MYLYHDQKEKLTVVGARGNAATCGAIDVANILLQAGVGCAACAVGNGATGILRRRCREGERCKRNKNGDGELHGCGGGR
jgi:hypothetical protein